MIALEILFTIAVVAVTFLILIAPHEGGHFGAAKLTRMRVIEFSVGMGPRLLSGFRGTTFYALRVLPIGGYVRLGGMEPGDYQDPQGFHAKPAYQRLLVLVAGPLVNFVVASLIVTSIHLSEAGTQLGQVASVLPNSPAAAAGLKPGDVIESFDGHPLQSSGDLGKAEQQNPNVARTLVVKHPDGTTQTVVVKPRWYGKLHQFLIGIFPKETYREALVTGITFPVTTIGVIFGGMQQLVTGQVPGGPFGPQGFTGPVGIAAMTSQTAHAGVTNWLFLVALLSVALGFFNLLPIPALDGGRILVVLLEKVRGHPFDREREMRVQRYGLAALLSLVVVISYFDVQRIVTHQFPGIH